ncbi:MAG: AAA family ATPase [Rhodovibrionaceae bacterium]
MVEFTKLRLSGFKSFVDPTELTIERGVTGIVGPNGCGKSNLVEALRWAMGENSAKRMRGSEMDDVIFAGSSNRPSRNLAEVQIHLDNADRSAPAQFNDQPELEVVRRIEREKGSDYKVNGKNVRARDVQLLFADSATGAHSPAIVSQGRIGAVINAKPADRRSLLEEAAGISGLHSRRHEAELRLRAAETNLERLDDVVGTLESQLAGLKKQARQATRYRNIAGHLRRNEAILLHIDRQAASAQLGRCREVLQTAEAAVAELTQRAAAATTAQAEAAEGLPQLRQCEAEAAAALQRLVVERDGLNREEQQLAEARQNAGARLEQIEGDLKRAAALGEDAEKALAELAGEQSRLATEQDGEAERREAAATARDSAAETLRAEEEAYAALAERVAAGEARASALESRGAELRQRLQRLEERLAQVKAERAGLESRDSRGAELEAAESEANEAERALDSARSQAETAERSLIESREREAEARDAQQTAKGGHGRLEAEAAALSTVLETGESDIWPPMVDAVTVAAGYEPALGAALGDDLTAPADEAAPVHWESLPPFSAPPALPAGAEPLGSFVKGPQALARRLSQVGVVADAATGARLISELTPGQRLVTKDGALWRWDGLTAKADAPTSAAQRLAQRNRLEALKGLIAEAESELQKRDAALAAARERSKAAAVGERGAREAQRAAYARLAKAKESLSQIRQEVSAASSRIQALGDSLGSIENDLKDARDALDEAEAERAALPDLESARRERDSRREALGEARSQLNQAEAELQRNARETEARQSRLAAIGRESGSWQRRRDETRQHAGELEQRRERLSAEIAALDSRPADIAERREALAGRIETAETARKSAADALSAGESRRAAADKDLKAAESDLAAAREERVRAEAAVQQGEQSLESLAQRIAEKLECAPEQLLEIAELTPEDALPPRGEVEGKLQRLIRERDNIGPVNLRAETEAQELEEQIAGMQHERADLVAAIARLRSGISSLNREGRERLLAAFETVNSHFSELFIRLFGGGRAHLKLTESDDPLDAGLEIMASPPGKRLQVMSLLSGGEQALTAMALLFAVFLTNPAPICVLDEVDAPLDDSNVDRFCSLVEEMAQSLKTRFLIITHHRLTMARVDRLYGVTMGERGVSQLVSVDLEGADALRESA